MNRNSFTYETPQYHLIRAMDYAGEMGEKAGEAFDSLIDALAYGAGEFDYDCILDSAKDSLLKAMSEAFSAVNTISAVFAESVKSNDKKGEETNGTEEES